MMNEKEATAMRQEHFDTNRQSYLASYQNTFDKKVANACYDGKWYFESRWDDFGFVSHDEEAFDAASEDFVNLILDLGYEVGYRHDAYNMIDGIIVCWGPDKETECYNLSERY